MSCCRRSAIQLTLLVTVITGAVATVVWLVGSVAIDKIPFRGRQLLITLIEVPFAVSPVIAGLAVYFVIWCSRLFWRMASSTRFPNHFRRPRHCAGHDVCDIAFYCKGTHSVNGSRRFPAEEASLTLGAGGWRTFWHVTLPAIKWGLLYGVILCSARAIGEFGAVSVVSGRIRGQTNTMPLHIEILYNEYQFTASFAVAALMSLFALVTIGVKQWVEWRQKRRSYDDLTEQN